LDYDVRFGQGILFSPPRPVRAEALQGGSGGFREAGTAPLQGGSAAAGPGANLGQLARAGMRRN
ncbi:MAG: EAL domain-containing protein, partial [Xanthobacteraceae bacterium]